jgi:hypothetical protein
MNPSRVSVSGWGALILIFWVGGMPELSRAQEDKAVKMESVEVQFIKAPGSLGPKLGGRVKSTDNWMAVTFTYQPFPFTGQTFLDEVQFKVYIEGREFKDDRDKDGTTVVLPGEVTYVNVRGQKGMMGAMFVHPDTVERYGLEKESNRLNVFVEAYEKGQLVDGMGKNTRETDEEWYKGGKYPAKENLVYRQDQSVFLLTDTDGFPAIKLETK